jgi:hypothetical protein
MEVINSTDRRTEVKRIPILFLSFYTALDQTSRELSAPEPKFIRALLKFLNSCSAT